MSAFVKDRIHAPGGASFPERTPDFRQVDFEARARQVLDDAQRRGAAIERRAYEEGFEKGERAGLALGKEQLVPALEELHSLIQGIAGAKDNLVRSMEKDIVKLALTIAERVVHHKIAEDDVIVLEAVRKAIDEFTDRGPWKSSPPPPRSI
ncbi:MAG: hypothetical protein H6683_00845 [Deltaproteobacteria bacterium]|nr:hypothetical protein [Deltaproteobacteria bacterium]